MRLTEDQIKEGILHENIIARSVALHHYSGSYSQDPSILSLAVQAVEAYGWSGLVDFNFKAFDGLAVTAETASWIVDQLQREKERKAAEWDGFRRALLACVLQADVEVLRPLRDEIAPLEFLDLPDRQKLNLRLEWSTRSPQACWQELEDLAEQCASPERDRFPRPQVRRAEAVISELAPRADEFADRVLELLALDLGDEGTNPRLWLQGMMIILSGRMRLAAAAPLLIKRLHDDWDWYSEQCQTSLKRIGGNAALDAISKDYATVPWHVRLYACGALETIHAEGATQRLSHLAELEREFAARGDDSSLLLAGICSGLAHQFETTALHLARELIIEDEFDPELRWTRREVVGASLLMGESIPELGEWKEDVEQEMNRQQTWYGGGPHFAGGSKPLPGAPSIFDAAAKAPANTAPVETHFESTTAVQPITRSGTRVGRNDPCPCGSGKKYKKCCLRRDSGTSP